ncbi:MAG: type VI secretion system tip protein TssI/VgrG [Polyangiaceae bacterium]
MQTLEQTRRDAVRPLAAPGSTPAIHHLTIPSVGPEPLLVHRFRGTEELSGVFRFDVRATARRDGAAPLVDELLGQPAILRFGNGSSFRTIHGLIATAGTVDACSDADRVSYRLRIVPRLWLLRHRHRSRIFQRRRVDEVISEVLADAGILASWSMLEPREALPVREFVTQYQESDLEFVTRLAAEAGFLFRLADGEDGESLVVFGDGPAAYARPSLSLRYSVSSTDAGDDDRLTAFSEVLAIRANTAAYREFDPRRPDALIEARTASELTPGSVLERYDHHADFQQTVVAHAEREPARALRRLRARARRARGEARNPWLAAGQCFTFSDSSLARGDREHVVTSVIHKGWDRPRGGHSHLYENAFECIPADVVAAPPLPPRRGISGTLTAIVVGADGAQIHTEPSACVKVQFHWDRDGKRDEHSSCWLRTMQPWAGAGWGSQFVPRIGMEVVVSFDGGDPDRPFVLGALYNGAHPPPFPLPQEADRSGIRTNSLGAEGFNELSFSDRAGDEQIYLHAQADLEEVVLRDHATTVSRDRREEISRDASSRVLGDRSTETMGSAVTKTAGSSDVHVAGLRTELLGGGRRVVVRGDHTTRTTGRSTHSVGEAYSLQVGSALSAEVGTADKPGSASLFSFGAASLGSASTVTLSAEQRIVLQCGEARLELSTDTIRLSAPKVLLEAQQELVASGDGPRLALDKSAQLTAQEIRMYSSHASVELDRIAHVDGEIVKLACGPDSPTGKGAKKLKPRTQALHLRLTNAAYEPYAGKAYIVKASGLRFEGTTDGDGNLRELLPADARSADITLWIGERPSGKTRRYAVSLEPLPPPDTPRGITTRLKHLGYYHRAPTDQLDAPARQAIQSFQRDHGLPATGEPDSQTIAKLVAIHGS